MHLSILTLFAEYNILSCEIESWRGFAECLPPSDKEEFLKMLQNPYDYSTAINATATEVVLLALSFEQHKLIQWLKSKFDAKNE